VKHLRRFAGSVVLVFDADAGGQGGVDRALEVFVRHDLDLRIATLPEGLDPCDLLLAQGAEPFVAALTNAVDVLQFKLDRVWAAESGKGVEGQRRAMDAVLRILALAPEPTGQAAVVKQQLIVNGIASRLLLKEEIVWARLQELRKGIRAGDRAHPLNDNAPPAEPLGRRAGPARPLERDFLQLLLADPTLVPLAAEEVSALEVEHPGLRLLLEGLYRLRAEGQPPTLELLRQRIDNPPLMQKALELQEEGLGFPDRAAALRDVLAEFRKLRAAPIQQALLSKTRAAGTFEAARELLQELQNRTQ